jgi:hypothetical protein
LIHNSSTNVANLNKMELKNKILAYTSLISTDAQS